jgi:serine/threonine-protein kinase PpkA
VILFEMLTRQKPFRAENPMAIVYQHRKAAIPQLPPKFVRVQPVLEKLLAKLPQDRFASAAEAALAIEETLARWRARGAGR